MKTPMKLSEADKNKLNEWLDYPSVQHIIGRGRHTIHRLVKEGTLDKIGYGRSARISLKSILDYLQVQREIAQVAATVPNTTLRKAADWARQKKHELKMKRALELVAAGATAAGEHDPRLETCVFEGVCMSRADADEIRERQWRAQ
jgi:hypothetical protein